MVTQIHHRDLLHAEGGEIGFHSGPELFKALRRGPLALVISLGANFGHRHQVVGIRMQRVGRWLALTEYQWPDVN